MGKCSSKKKKADPEDPPYGAKDAVLNGKVETDGDKDALLHTEKEDKCPVSPQETKHIGVTLNINANNVTIGRAGELFKVNDDPAQNSNNGDAAKVLSQPLLKELYTPADESRNGQLVTVCSKTSNQDPFGIDLQCIKDSSFEREKVKIDEVKFGNVKSTDTEHEEDKKETADDLVQDKIESQKTESETNTIERQKSETTSPKQTDRRLTNSGQLDSLEQDCPFNKELNNLMSDSTTTNHCGSPNPNSGIDTLDDSTITTKRSEWNNSAPNSSEIFGNGHMEQHKPTGTSKVGNCKMGHTTTFAVISDENHLTNATSEPGHSLGGNVTGATNLPENPASNFEERSLERQNKSSIPQNKNEQHAMTPDEGRTENQNIMPQSTDRQDVDIESLTSTNTMLNVEDGLTVDHDTELDAAPTDTEIIIQDEEIVGSTSAEKTNKEAATAGLCRDNAMRSIEIIADLGQNSMAKNLKIALEGNNEAKISNGGEIGSTARTLSQNIRSLGKKLWY